MLGRFKNQEEEWIPCSDWGRQQKLRNEEYMRELARAKRQAKRDPKPKPKRVRVRAAVCRDYGTCRCGSSLGPQNKSGVCAGCYSKHRTEQKEPRKPCPDCGALMNRNNKLGVCRKCGTSAVRAGRERYVPKFCACGKPLGNRNKSGVCAGCVVAAMPAKRQCAKCPRLLHPTNKTGLCVKHSPVARQQAYMARKAA